MEFLIFSGKQPSWYIIFATSISVKMLSGTGALFSGIPFGANSTSLLVTGVNPLSVKSPLCCRHRARLCIHAILPISFPVP